MVLVYDDQKRSLCQDPCVQVLILKLSVIVDKSLYKMLCAKALSKTIALMLMLNILRYLWRAVEVQEESI